MRITWLALIISLSLQAKCQNSSVIDNVGGAHIDLSEGNETSVDPIFIPVHYERALVWNPTRETARQLHARVCTDRCNGTKKVSFVGSRCLQCMPCSCDTYCHLYGTCCRPLDPEARPPQTPTFDGGAICKMLGGSWLFHVVTCHPRYPHNLTRAMCESPDSYPRTPDTVLPVTALDTSVTYANLHCAHCRRAPSALLTEWRMTCRHNQYLYDVLNDTQYDARAVLLPDVCTPGPAPSGKGHNCNPTRAFLLSADAISTCNVTGEWAKDEEHVRKACEESEWSSEAVMYVLDKVYSNVFCAMCNEVPYRLTPSCQVNYDIHHETSVVTHTDLVKGLHGEVTKSVTTIRAEDCPKAQWKHPSRGCLKLQCSKGKVAGPGQQCVTAVDRVRGLGYRLKMALQPVALTTRLRLPSDATTTTPSTTEPTSSQTPLSVPVTNDSQSQHTQKHDCDYRAVLNEAIKHVFWAVSTEVSSTLTAAATQDQACFYHKYRSSLDTLMADGKVRPHATDNVVGVVEREIGEADQLSASFLAAVAEVNVVASQKEGRDDVESKALRKVFAKNWTVDLGQWTVTLRALDMTSGLFKDGEGAAGFVHLKGGDTDQSSFRFFKMNPTEPLDGLEHLFLLLSDLLVCQHLRFHEDEFEVEVSQRKVEIRFPNYLDADLQPVSFDARDYSSKLRLVGEELVMCHYVYLDVFPENVTVVHPGRGVSLARQITSIVCSSISVLCLAATFLTYSLFSELRSLPGLNNMGLCFTLAIAHLSLLIPWLRSSGSENVCVAVGVVTHWLWLTALLWMNVGCVHMVRVFFAKTRHALTQREVKKAFLHNVLFTVLLSVGAVALTAVVTVAVSGGASTGYGGKLCFLDTGFDPLLILAFLLPLGGVVVTNLLCFLLTVVAIMRVRRLQATVGSARRDVLVYAKLATVTGLGWVLVVLAEFSGHQEWLLVLAELCTASQGLLLFLSYVCNTRVWRMYRARFGSSRAPSAPIPASTTTVVTMSDSTKAPPPADA